MSLSSHKHKIPVQAVYISIWFRFSFAEAPNMDEVEKAIKSMDGKEIEGRRLRVRGSKVKKVTRSTRNIHETLPARWHFNLV